MMAGYKRFPAPILWTPDQPNPHIRKKEEVKFICNMVNTEINRQTEYINNYKQATEIKQNWI